MNKIAVLSIMLFVVSVLSGVTYAAFMDRGKILGSSFSVGSANIKLLSNLALGVEESNLVDEKQGPTFSNISPNWSSDYLVKVYNDSTTELSLSSNSNYETVNDPEDLRTIIYVEPMDWNDVDNNGEVTSSELGQSYGKKTIVKWKTEGFNLGTISGGVVRSFVFRFSTQEISDSKQGAFALFDFEFSSLGL